MDSLLVVTSDKDQQRRLTSFFTLDGYSVSIADRIEDIFTHFEKNVYSVAVIEIVSDLDSDIIKQILKTQQETMIILAHSGENIGLAVSLVNIGAFESIEIPYKLGTLYNKVEQAVRIRKLQLETQSLRGERDLIYWSGDLIGHSPTFQKVLKQVHKIARSDTSVILHGESGTGKEVIAGVIHYNSLRSSGAFVRVNCAALHDDLLESELFGHEKGAFTGAVNTRIGRFEHANGGTIFLDEIADMSLKTQAKVLRVLQEQEFERVGSNRTIHVNVRIISATNKNLEDEIEAGRFREDLYYRLNVITLVLPPLRDRRQDIMPLALHFLMKFSTSMSKTTSGFEPDAEKELIAYDWPGNIRELRNRIERGVLFTENDLVDSDDLGLAEMQRNPDRFTELSADVVSLPETGVVLEEVERSLIQQALERTGWVQKKAANLLGITPRVLNYKIKRFGFTCDKWIVNSD